MPLVRLAHRPLASSSLARHVDVALVLVLVLAACSGAEPPAPPTRTRPALAAGAKSLGAIRSRTSPTLPSSSRAPVPRAPPPGPLPAAGAPLGTTHPYVLMGVSAERRWAVVCQARRDSNGDGAIDVRIGIHGETRGDEMLPYLVLGDGEGEPIDDLVASDPTGRWLAIRADDALVLVDSSSGERHDLDALGADATDDGSPFGGYRGGSFDDAGRLFAYVRNREGGRMVVVRDLAAGTESEIDPGPGELYRSFIDGAGRFVVLEVVASDTDHDGRVTLPRPATSLGPRRCRGPIRSYSTSGIRGDEPETRVGQVGHEHVRPVAGLVRAFGERLIVRRQDGALGVEAWGGAFEPWAPASCRAQLLAMLPSANRMLVGCDDPSSPHHAFAEPGRLVPLSIGARGGAIAPQDVLARVHVAYSEHTFDVADLATGRIARRRNAYFVALHGARVMTSEGADLVSWDLDTDRRTRTRVGRRARGGFARSGPIVAFAGVVYDFDADRVVGRYDGDPLAVSRDGHVLLQTAATSEPGSRIPNGPLVWRATTLERAGESER